MMKIVKTINSKNGRIHVYDNDIYKLRKPFYSYKSLVCDREDLMMDLLDAGFVIKKLELCLSTNNNGIVFYLDVNMKYLK